MSAIDEILEVLNDGKWHDSKQIMEKSGLPEFKIQMILSFLAEYNFVELDKKRQKTKLAVALVSFFKRAQRIERER